MSLPTPGHPVRAHRLVVPLWRPLICLADGAIYAFWELRDGQMGFRTVQARCDDMSPSVLSQRP